MVPMDSTMPDASEPVVVATPSPAASITTTVVKRRPYWVLLANIVNGVVSTVLAVLGYLQTVNLNGILTPEKALMWMVAVNVLTIILRQFASAQTVETKVEPLNGGN